MVATASSAALRSENLAGTVWLSAGAPATVSRPLTNTAVSSGFADGASALGSVVPARPASDCWAFSCCVLLAAAVLLGQIAALLRPGEAKTQGQNSRNCGGS